MAPDFEPLVKLAIFGMCCLALLTLGAIGGGLYLVARALGWLP